MSTSSKSKTSNRKGLAKDRPFALQIVKAAAGLTRRYQVLARWDADDDCYVGRCVELPNAIGAGDTEAECVAEVRGNINALVSFMLERGESPPLAEEPARTVQVNVRFAPYEKAAVETLAKAAEQSMSDYIRLSALRGP